MSTEKHNIFLADKASPTTEQFNILIQTPHLRLEQITSYGTASPDGFWYDQGETEWVLLAKGEAVLEYEGGKLVVLKAGDYLEIPAHEKHRVKSCSQDAIWLALFF